MQGCIKLRIGPRTVPVRSTYEQAGVLERLENPGAVVTAANRDGSRSMELDAALGRMLNPEVPGKAIQRLLKATTN